MLRWKELVNMWLLMAGLVATASGDDLPIIGVSRQGLTPDRIEVHVGELVRWRAVKGVRIRLEFDPHRDAQVVSRLMWKIGNGVLPAPERD